MKKKNMGGRLSKPTAHVEPKGLQSNAMICKQIPVMWETGG